MISGNRSLTLLAATLALGVAGGCTKSTPVEIPELEGTTASLLRPQTCDGVLRALQDDAVAKTAIAAEDFRRGASFGRGGVGVDVPTAAPVGPVPTAEPAAFGDADTSGSTEERAAAPPAGFSETNTQVAGVDEADIVKTDGDRVYLLHGRELFVLQSWPADATAVEQRLGIEGNPTEMFVDGERVAVFSQVWDHEGDLGGKQPCDYGRGGPFPGGGPGVPVEPGIGAASFADDVAYACGASFTKVTLVELGGGAAQVTRELYVEGDYRSSRRHDSRVRAVIGGGYGQPADIPDMWEYLNRSGRWPDSDARLDRELRAWQAAAEDAIRDTTLEEWLPTQVERVDGEYQTIEQDCGSIWVPSAGLTDGGMTRVLAFDMQTDERELAGALIAGAAYQVYANQDTMLLAHQDWSWFWRGVDGDQTVLHMFALDAEGLATQYVGSGFVPGHIHDQFSLDVAGGVIRVSTTQNQVGAGEDRVEPTFVEPTTINRVLTMGPKNGTLVLLGSTKGLAPGEQIFSTRFVGDRGYVVTFRQVDPLFVVDLSNPAELPVLGELKIPGFSDYMHPLDAGHLLTIGRDTDDSGGFVVDAGLALQIFDVTDPAQPRLAHKYVFAEGGYSEANHNHKAFTFYADKNLLAFPYVRWDANWGSTLQLFRVDAEQGFGHVGEVAHTPLMTDICSHASDAYWECSYQPEIRRGLFIDDYVYSISYGGVLVHAVDALNAEVARVDLPAPIF